MPSSQAGAVHHVLGHPQRPFNAFHQHVGYLRETCREIQRKGRKRRKKKKKEKSWNFFLSFHFILSFLFLPEKHAWHGMNKQ